MKRLLFLPIILIVCILAGCGKTVQEEPGPAPEVGRTIRFGYSPGSMDNPFTVEFYAYLEQLCSEAGIQLDVQDGENDVAKQMKFLQDWIREQYDVVICSPIEPTTLQPMIDDCMEAGIPFINLDSECQRRTTFLGVDQFDYGYQAGKIAADWLNAHETGETEVLCAVLTKPQSLAVIERANGIIQGLTENCAFTRIVATQPYSDTESAKTATLALLEEEPDLRCIVAVADFGILGAYEALQSLGRAEDESMCLVGIDATEPVLNMIHEKTIIRGTVSQDTKAFAERTVEAAIAALSGQVESAIILENEPVTQDNVNKFLEKDDGDT